MGGKHLYLFALLFLDRPILVLVPFPYFPEKTKMDGSKWEYGTRWYFSCSFHP
jgi:hypothetical protein